jgi:TolB-like protein
VYLDGDAARRRRGVRSAAWSVSRGVALVLAMVPCQAALAQPAVTALVIPFEHPADEPSLQWLGEGAAVLLTDELQSLGVEGLMREDRLRAYERLDVPVGTTLSRAAVVRLGRLVGATHVVVGSFDREASRIEVRVRAILLETGRMLPEILEAGPLDELVAVVSRVAHRLVPTAAPDPATGGRPSLSAFEQYIKGLLATSSETKLGYFDRALQLSPGLYRARLAQWQAYDARGEHVLALGAVQPVPAADALGRQARFQAALSLIHLSRYEDAMRILAALSDERADAALANNLGVIQMRRALPSWQGAVSLFSQASVADVADPDYLFNAGYASWFGGDVKGAVDALSEAVRRDDADAVAHYVLGIALQAAGSEDEAAREREVARRLSPAVVSWEAEDPPGQPRRGLERLKADIDLPAWFRRAGVGGASGQ